MDVDAVATGACGNVSTTYSCLERIVNQYMTWTILRRVYRHDLLIMSVMPWTLQINWLKYIPNLIRWFISAYLGLENLWYAAMIC